MQLNGPVLTTGSNSTGLEKENNEVIRLKLNKPENWRWELTTSKSSPHIAFPTIQLYDSKGILLAETNNSDCILRGSPSVSRSGSRNSWHPPSHCDSPDSIHRTSSKRKTHCRTHSDGSAAHYLGGVVNAPCNELVDNNGNEVEAESKISTPRVKKYTKSPKRSFSNKEIYSPPTTQAESNKNKNSGNKQRYRKSFSGILNESNNGILNKINENCAGDTSTDSDGNENKPERVRQKYKLRTSSAGTLLLDAESFKGTVRRRPQPDIVDNVNPSVNPVVKSSSQGDFRVIREYRTRPLSVYTVPSSQQKSTNASDTMMDRSAGKLVNTESVQSRNSSNNDPTKRRHRRARVVDSVNGEPLFQDGLMDTSTTEKCIDKVCKLLDEDVIKRAVDSNAETCQIVKRDININKETTKFEEVCELKSKKEKQIDRDVNRSDNEGGNNNVTKVKRFTRRKCSNGDVSTSSTGFDDKSKAVKKLKRKIRRKRKDNSNNTGDQLLAINNRPITGLEPASHILRTGPDPVLLRLVRRLASLQHNATYKHENNNNIILPDRSCRDRLSLTKIPNSPSHLPSIMGANVSRHSGKGLSGRRSQSSGNLCNNNGKNVTPNVSKFLGACAGNVGVKDRNKFCGSLPNHLDGPDDVAEEQPNLSYAGNNNNHVERVEYVTVAPGKKKPLQPTLFKNNTFRCERPRDPVELKLQPLWRGSDGGCDQGYGSERSPEEEFPPSLPGEDSEVDPHEKYPFITPECTFNVTVMKGPRGLGLSVTGGIETSGQLPGLIRIKRLFPHQPAWSTGQLAPGDLLLAANGVTLTGLSNYEALEVLRTTPSTVVITVCRPVGDDFVRLTPPSEPPPPPRRGFISAPAPPVPPLDTLEPEGPCGEFDIVLCKVNGSLGFTLRKEDQSVLGHYVRALVREPALSDGRIHPGDKIVAVNDVAMSPLSHEEAVLFLRQCGEQVKLRLYRDAVQTPVSAMSPTEPEVSRPKLHLRQEAMDMLCDLAVRKLSPGDSTGSSSRCRSPNSSPRRLRRLTRNNTAEVDNQYGDIGPNQKYWIVCQSTTDSDTSVNSQPNSFISQRGSINSKGNCGHPSLNHSISSGEAEMCKPIRPNFLDLGQQAAGTPVALRKPRFQFTVAANSYELNNLDNDVLDAPTIYTLSSNSDGRFHATSSDEYTTEHDCVSLPVSMPPLSSTSTTSTGFSYKNPAYQTAHPQCSKDEDQVVDSEHTHTENNAKKEEGTKSLLKWKGVVFTPEEEEAPAIPQQISRQPSFQTQRDQILTVELNRGWNSRLGFSLQADPISKKTVISAIYADSVAAKNGRLRTGDQVLMVNDESVELMPTTEVIDLLRIIRGSICITVLRKHNRE